MTEQSSAPSGRKPYKAPELVKWGTIADMTLNVGSTGSPDGASKGKTKTR